MTKTKTLDSGGRRSGGGGRDGDGGAGRDGDDSGAGKIYDPNAGVALADWLARLPRPLVFTNGCFDILHRGHIDCLQRAAALGESLLVGVNSDRSVRLQNKGAGRPVMPLEDRMTVLAALATVDAVVAFEQETPLQLILAARPEPLVKGGDWRPEQIAGAAEARGWGGQVHALPFRFARSTSEVIARIRDGDGDGDGDGGDDGDGDGDS